MEGYLTMDTISALAFGIIVVNAIRSKGVNDRKSIAIATAKAGLIAATGARTCIRCTRLAWGN